MSAFYINILRTLLCALLVLLASFYDKQMLLEVCLLNITNNNGSNQKEWKKTNYDAIQVSTQVGSKAHPCSETLSKAQAY